MQELKARLASPEISDALLSHPARLGWLARIVAHLGLHQNLDAQLRTEDDLLSRLPDLLRLLPNQGARDMLLRQFDTVGPVMARLRAGDRAAMFQSRLTKSREDLNQWMPLK